MSNQFFVLVLDRETDEEVKRMGPFSQRKAERVESGVEINMDHDRYYTSVVEEKERAQ